jgi:nucleotide-binding universal stress UspA family protein
MQKHILITIGDDATRLYGARFVSSFFRKRDAMSITLFYVAPQASAPAGPVKTVRPTVSAQQQEKGQKALDPPRSLLIERGFLPEHIDCKLMPRQFGTVKDIIRESGAGLYDAVVLGRRGYTMFETMLSYSVTRDIMDHDISFPLWICRRPEEGRKNVLLCIDGSEAGLRIADHVGFMLQDEEEHHVTIFQVDTGAEENMKASMEDAKRALMDNGVPEERIKTRARSSGKVAEAILQEARDGAYAVVAVGRVGQHKEGVRKWIFGSTSLKLMENLDKAVLWVSK